MRIERKLNLSDPTHKGILFQEIGLAGGWHNVAMSPARAKARQAQFGYYFAVVLPLATQWLNETQGGIDEDTEYSDHEADIWLKTYLRGVPVADPRTGEQLSTIVPSKAAFTTKQMFEFTDDVVALLRKFGVKVPPPDKNWRDARAAVAA